MLPVPPAFAESTAGAIVDIGIMLMNSHLGHFACLPACSEGTRKVLWHCLHWNSIDMLLSAPAEQAMVAAICETDEKRLSGDWTDIQGNFGPPGEKSTFRALPPTATWLIW